MNGPAKLNSNHDDDDCDDDDVVADEDEHFLSESIIEDNSSEEHFRNPSPPSEFLQAGVLGGDTIKGTVVSERWVLRTLMKLSKAAENVNKFRNSPENKDLVCELDDDLETNLCQLWDLSVEKDVVLFLLTLPALNIFTDALSCSTFPRLTEIVVGIIGNMACVTEACDVMPHNDPLCQALQATLDSCDPPTLVGVFRVYEAFLQNVSSSKSWLEKIENDQNLPQRITFIAFSSSNCSLLKSLGTFLELALSMSDNLCAHWSSKDLVSSMLEAIQQIGYDDLKVIETYYSIIEFLWATDEGKESIEEQQEVVIASALSYLKHALASNEDFINIKDRSIGVMCSLSFLEMLLKSNPCGIIQSLEKAHFIRCILKLLSANYAQGDGEPADKLLEDSLGSIMEEIFSTEEGIKFFLCSLKDCEEVYMIESFNAIRKLCNSEFLFRCIHSTINSLCESQDFKRLIDVMGPFE